MKRGNVIAFCGAAVAVASFFVMQHRSRRRAAALKKDAQSADTVTEQLRVWRLPIFVDPAKLCDGWAVAPALFYPCDVAVLPLVAPLTPKDGNIGQDRNIVKVNLNTALRDNTKQAFIFCEGPIGLVADDASFLDEAAEVSYFTGYVREHVLLRGFLGPSFQTCSVKSLAAWGIVSESKAYTCMVHTPSATLVLGRHGAFVYCAVFIGLAGTFIEVPQPPNRAEGENESTAEGGLPHARQVSLQNSNHANDSKASTTTAGNSDGSLGSELYSAVRMLLPATSLAPLVYSSIGPCRFLGTPAGAGEGVYRVSCAYNDQVTVFKAPSGLRIRSTLSSFAEGPLSKGAALVTFEQLEYHSAHHGTAAGATAVTVRLSVTPAILADIHAKHTNGESGTLEVFVPEESEQLEEETADAATAHVISQRRRLAKSVCVTIPSNEHAGANDVTVLYRHPTLGVFFSVNAESGVVYEPLLTDNVQVVYYPLGEAEQQQQQQQETTDPPRVTLERISPLPHSWESGLNDDEELLHNVKFHFTEWDTMQTKCTLASLSGDKCVQFTESKKGRCCRTYVVPRDGAVLAIRWEAEEALWDKMLPVLQLFMDTLHLEGKNEEQFA